MGDGFTTKTVDERLAEGLEMARCTQVNMDNFARVAPGVAATMPFKLVKLQIDQTIAALEGAEEETP